MSTNVAFEILYKDYYVRVFGLCLRLLNSRTLAEDAAQETFVRAYRTFGKYDNDQPFWQWIASIANHHCIDLLRRKNRTDRLFDEESEEVTALADAETQPLSQAIASEEQSVLSAAIAELPDRYRVPLVLAYYNGSSYDEIAGALSINRNHVGVLLLRAKRQLRALVEQGRAEGGAP